MQGNLLSCWSSSLFRLVATEAQPALPPVPVGEASRAVRVDKAEWVDLAEKAAWEVPVVQAARAVEHRVTGRQQRAS